MRVSDKASKQGRCQAADRSASRSDLRLVAIASRHSFGDRILRRLAETGIRLHMLVITVHQHPTRDRAKDSVRTLARRWRARVWALLTGWRRWRRTAGRISVVDSPTDRRLHALLAKARPDILVLAGTGVLPGDLLSVPRLVTLNAHPGLLPWVRGVCPFEHALLRGVPLGITVHAVDAGIDTGPVIRRVLLPVTENDTDRLALIARLEESAIGALTDVVTSLLRGHPLRPSSQKSKHAYGRWVSAAERERALALLQEGEAVRLYRQWHEVAAGDVLPTDDRELASILPRSEGER